VGLVPALQAAVESADVIWVEWGNAFAAYLSQAQLDKPVIIRIHRYEAQTQWPQFIETSGLDAMVFVADWVRQVVNMHRPALAHVPQFVIPLGLDAARFDRPKLSGFEKTLALVGWNSPRKDPDWAINVLDVLNEKSSGWKLKLVGGNVGANSEWGRALTHRIAEHASSIELMGYRTDMNVVFQEVGYLISASRSEGIHTVVMEGAAARCVPVVRDWPEVKHLNGAGDIYPHEWLVNTPQEAADRILAVPTPDAAAREFITTNMGFDTVNTEIMALVRGNF
ncbi:MAG: glycosyltransferase, partial [Arcanobacterium sp.]|nr:glycosyltransferase [Arcanobacterium sp.]